MTVASPLAPALRDGRHGYVRLRGRWPLIVRLVWVASLAVTTISSLIPGFPLYLALLRTPCATPTCPFQQLTPAQGALLDAIGVTPSVYVALSVALALGALVVCWIISALIIWRRPDDWMAALVALLLISYGPLAIEVSLGAPPVPFWLRAIAFVLSNQTVMLAVVFCLFPSGRFAPRWSAWVLVAVTLSAVLTDFVPQRFIQQDTAFGKVGFVVAVIQFIALAVCQIVRYRTVSTPLERQQTKWVVIGFTTPISYLVALVVAALIFPTFFSRSAIGVLIYFENPFLIPLFLAIGFALAMMRYRLWDVDALINRALVYGALTLILTAAYAGLVIGLQALSRGFIGQDNSIVIVLSTLVIAALVLPLRRWLQAFIDRAFYRSHFDSTRTLETFSATLRHELRVEALREQLLHVVEETMQPAHVSLWLRPATLEVSRREGEE